MKEENVKTADNKINRCKSEIDILDSNIYNSKKTIECLNNIEENFEVLNKNLTTCIELLNRAIKGKKAKIILNEVSGIKSKNIKSSLSSIDEYRTQEEKKIRKYDEEREKLIEKRQEEIKKSTEEVKKEEENNIKE